MPAKPSLTEIQEAAERMRGVVLHTPLVPLHHFGGQPDILLKLEIHQVVTSFKIRGVYNAVASLTPRCRARGLSTVSAGNTAQALAWVGRHFGVPARSVMPDSAPVTKIDAVKRYGGEPVLVPMAEVFRFLKERLWENEPYAFVHPWTNRDLWIGHGTIGLEIVEDCPEVDTVYVPVGGGGLMSGVGTALKALRPDVRVIAVQAETCAALHDRLRCSTGSKPAAQPAGADHDTLCDGVAVPYVTEEVFPILQEVVDDVVLVSERDVRRTIKRLAVGNRIVAEGAGALSVAAALAVQPEERGKTVCLITGGSIDTDKFRAILGDP